MFKNFFLYLFLCLLIIPLCAKKVSADFELPSIYIESVKIDKDMYQSGDTLKATYVLSNKSTFDVNDLYFLVSISNSEDFSVDLGKVEGVSIKSKEKQSKEVEFKLPESGSDNISLKIKAYMC